MSKIGVLVVTYNQKDITLIFLKTFLNIFNNNPDISLLVLDNNSNDATFENVKLKYPNVDCRLLNQNYGCVIGRNIGIIELLDAGCDYLCILDNDIEITDSNFFDLMSKFMNQNTNIDGCCPIVKWGDDLSLQTMGFGVSINNFNNTDIPILPIALPGCAQFIRAEAFRKYGLYDNDLSPVSIEDYEWGYRSYKKGLKLACNTNSFVLHHHKRGVPDNLYKRAMVIQGKTVFIRKNPSIYNIFKEIYCIARQLVTYSPSFIFKNYFIGLTKETNILPIEYDKFANLDRSLFFK